MHHAGLLLTMVFHGKTWLFNHGSIHFDHGDYDNLLVHHGNLV